MAISETYASPGLRLALYRLDHPGAPQPRFEEKPAAEVGQAGWLCDSSAVPAQRASTMVASFIVCTLDAGDGTDPDIGLKEVPSREKVGDSWGELQRTPETFEKLSTKALGRALKRAGYPADMDELRAVMAWRRRRAEIAALDAGRPLPTAEATPAEAELANAGQASEDHDPEETDATPTDPGNRAPGTGQAASSEATKQEPAAVAADERGGMVFPPGELGQRVVGLDGDGQAKVLAYLRERKLDPRGLSDLKAKALKAYVASLERDMRRGAQTPSTGPGAAAAPDTRPEAPAGASVGPSGQSQASDGALPLDSPGPTEDDAKPSDDVCGYCTGEIGDGDRVWRWDGLVFHAVADTDGVSCFASYQAERTEATVPA